MLEDWVEPPSVFLFTSEKGVSEHIRSGAEGGGGEGRAAGTDLNGRWGATVSPATKIKQLLVIINFLVEFHGEQH